MDDILQNNIAILAILPYLVLILLVLYIKKRQWAGWRESLLLGTTLWGLIITALTEILSLFNAITFLSFIIFWSALLVILIAVFILSENKLSFLDIKAFIKTLNEFELAMIVGVVVLIIAVGITAFIYPPNTGDSVTYHMSRVIHWIQNQNLRFFPTSFLNENDRNPWTEFAILQFQILGKGDLFANSINWVFMIGSIIGVTLIAKKLNVSTRGQIYTALFCATIPMVVLQGSSTQTNLPQSFWLICFIYFAMQLIDRFNFFHVIGAGAALGLSILTRVTSYLFAFPFLLWMVFLLFKHKVTKKWLTMILIALLTLAINSGHYVRNFGLYGNPIGIASEQVTGLPLLTNEVFSPSAITSNVVRNIAIQFRTPFPKLNFVLTRIVVGIHDRILNIHVSDPRTTFAWTPNFIIGLFDVHEDGTANIWHMILIIAFSLLYLIKKPRPKDMGLYILLVFIGFLMFCSVIKWNVWNSRLHIPLFILFSPLLGYSLSKISSRLVSLGVAIPFLMASLIFLFQSNTRPLDLTKMAEIVQERDRQYFNNRYNADEIDDYYINATQALISTQCNVIGMNIPVNTLEYPLYIFLEKHFGDDLVLEHVNVSNLSSMLTERFPPNDYCAILKISTKPPKMITVQGRPYSLYWSENGFQIYRP